MFTVCGVIAALFAIVLLFLTRVYLILSSVWRSRAQFCGQFSSVFESSAKNGSPRKHVKIMIVVGSGGHTAEILKLVGTLDQALFKPRDYVVADTDTISCNKIITLEEERQAKMPEFTLCSIPRSREVRQSWPTTVISTIRAFIHSLSIVFKSSPDVLLCNGPGTCVPLCLVAFIYGVLGIKRTKIIFVESVCRVKTMSLTGRILYYFSDHVIVQWPELQARYPRTIYLGRIV